MRGASIPKIVCTSIKHCAVGRCRHHAGAQSGESCVASLNRESAKSFAVLPAHPLRGAGHPWHT